MPPGVVEALALHGLSSAEEVAHAFDTGDRLAAWAAKKVHPFEAAAVGTLLAADRQLRRETDFDSPQAPEEKCTGTNSSSSAVPPPPTPQKGGGGKKGDDSPQRKGPKLPQIGHLRHLLRLLPLPLRPKRLMAEPLIYMSRQPTRTPPRSRQSLMSTSALGRRGISGWRAAASTRRRAAS